MELSPWRTPARFVAAVVVSYITLVGTSCAFSLSGTIFDSAARSEGLDPHLLYAVALAESAYSSDTPGFIAPSCLAIRASKPYYPKNRTEAREILERFIPGKENVDIGCMQISWRWHGKRFKSPEQLLDPATNISAASSILRNSIDSVPGQLALGIGRYHHWNISTTEGYERATSYGRRVLEILGNLRLLARHQ